MVPSSERGTQFVEVALPLAIPKLLTYHVPPGFDYPIKIGKRVIVSLGAKKVLMAVVIQCHGNTPSYPTKPIVAVLDEEPIINDYQVKFFTWIAGYYMCSLGEVFRAALPSGFKRKGEFRVHLIPNLPDGVGDRDSLSEPAQELLQQLGKLTGDEGASFKDIAAWLGLKLVHSTVKELLEANCIFLKEALQTSYVGPQEWQVSLRADFLKDDVALHELFGQLESNPKQLSLLLEYISLVGPMVAPAGGATLVSKKALLSKGLSASALETLLKKNVFIQQWVSIPTTRVESSTTFQPVALSHAQEVAFQAIKEHFTAKMVVVFHGVTGSGKTEVYVRLMQECLASGKQVLYLLPEIALATQIVQRLRNRVGHPIGVYHSKYTMNERLEIWNGMLGGKAQLIVGTRSAIFLPFSNLGLVVVDEEHELSYKQWEGTPRYHARDAVLMLSHYHGSNVVLGSATPSMETYYKARVGKYALVELVERFQQTSLPAIKVVDMRVERQRRRLHGLFSETLKQGLEMALANHEQAIIFQNRRGYATYILCQVCSWIPMCIQCSVSLTYHQYRDCLICHYCGYHMSLPTACPLCQSSDLKNKGFGTEKLEEALQQLFPDQKIQRMDLDTTRKKNSYEQILSNLAEGRTGILVGTQMVTKGLDFGNVTLVGIVDMDSLLYFPDFRSHERSFQVVMQVGGRAGRREKQGQVIIQTSHPDHPVLSNLLAYDYQKMYEEELTDRRKFRYPPYVRLVKVTFQHEYGSLAMQVAQIFKSGMAPFINPKLLLGPEMSLVSKVKNVYRVDLWIKLERGVYVSLAPVKEKMLRQRQELLVSKTYRGVDIVFDVDPL